MTRTPSAGAGRARSDDSARYRSGSLARSDSATLALPRSELRTLADSPRSLTRDASVVPVLAASRAGGVLSIEVPTVEPKGYLVELKIVNTTASSAASAAAHAPSSDDLVCHLMKHGGSPFVTEHPLSDAVDVADVPTSADRDPILTTVGVPAPVASHLDDQPIESLTLLTTQHAANENGNLSSFSGGESDDVRDPIPIESFNAIGDLPSLDADFVPSESRPISPSHILTPFLRATGVTPALQHNHKR
jgi:hypothetical protein